MGNDSVESKHSRVDTVRILESLRNKSERFLEVEETRTTESAELTIMDNELKRPYVARQFHDSSIDVVIFFGDTVNGEGHEMSSYLVATLPIDVRHVEEASMEVIWRNETLKTHGNRAVLECEYPLYGRAILAGFNY